MKKMARLRRGGQGEVVYKVNLGLAPEAGEVLELDEDALEGDDDDGGEDALQLPISPVEPGARARVTMGRS